MCDVQDAYMPTTYDTAAMNTNTIDKLSAIERELVLLCDIRPDDAMLLELLRFTTPFPPLVLLRSDPL